MASVIRLSTSYLTFSGTTGDRPVLDLGERSDYCDRFHRPPASIVAL